MYSQVVYCAPTGQSDLNAVQEYCCLYRIQQLQLYKDRVPLRNEKAYQREQTPRETLLSQRGRGGPEDEQEEGQSSHRPPIPEELARNGACDT